MQACVSRHCQQKVQPVSCGYTKAVVDMASAMTLQEKAEQTQQVQDYENAFIRIKECTGVADVNEVIQKFLTQEQTQQGERNKFKK